jgi:hypothetical protein
MTFAALWRAVDENSKMKKGSTRSDRNAFNTVRSEFAKIALPSRPEED